MRQTSPSCGPVWAKTDVATTAIMVEEIKRSYVEYGSGLGRDKVRRDWWYRGVGCQSLTGYFIQRLPPRRKMEMVGEGTRRKRAVWPFGDGSRDGSKAEQTRVIGTSIKVRFLHGNILESTLTAPTVTVREAKDIVIATART